MAAKIADLIEYGYNPEQIISQFIHDDEMKDLAALEGNSSGGEEVFPDAIRIISQALAYRPLVVKSDLMEVHSLLASAYRPEVEGDESFRLGDSIEINSLIELMHGDGYQWLIVEAPSGKGIEPDGVILGAACFSADGSFKVSSTVKESLGSIRFLAVLPRYQGFCLGQRLLERVEQAIFKANCQKVMVCIPSCRLSMVDWIQRRGYAAYGEVRYPAAGVRHVLKDGCHDVDLIRFIKDSEQCGAAASQPPALALRPTRDKLGRVVGCTTADHISSHRAEEEPSTDSGADEAPDGFGVD